MERPRRANSSCRSAFRWPPWSSCAGYALRESRGACACGVRRFSASAPFLTRRRSTGSATASGSLRPRSGSGTWIRASTSPVDLAVAPPPCRRSRLADGFGFSDVFGLAGGFRLDAALRLSAASALTPPSDCPLDIGRRRGRLPAVVGRSVPAPAGAGAAPRPALRLSGSSAAAPRTSRFGGGRFGSAVCGRLPSPRLPRWLDRLDLSRHGTTTASGLPAEATREA